jgi:uncharacterized membrane protein
VVSWKVVACTLALTACTADQPATGDAAAEPAVATLHGIFEFGTSGVRFKPCELDLDLAAEDRSGELVDAFRDLVEESFGRMYAEVVGRYEPDSPNRPPRKLIVTELRRSALESPGCEDSLGGVLFRAMGSEPGWNADVTEDGITFVTDSIPERVDLPQPSITDSAEYRIFTTAAADGRAFRLSVRPVRCLDPLSGARFSFEAQLALDSLRLAGCAAEGWP